MRGIIMNTVAMISASGIIIINIPTSQRGSGCEYIERVKPVKLNSLEAAVYAKMNNRSKQTVSMVLVFPIGFLKGIWTNKV